jgi:hypothetical protein
MQKIWVISLIIGLSLCASFIFAQEGELTVEETKQEINRARIEYQRLKNKMEAEEEELIKLIESIRSCRVSKYDTSHLHGNIASFESWLMTVLEEFAKINIGVIENELNNLNQEIAQKKADLDAKKAELRAKQAQLIGKQRKLRDMIKKRDGQWKKISAGRQADLLILYNRLEGKRLELVQAPPETNTRALETAISELEIEYDDLARKYKIPGYRRLLEGSRALESEITLLETEIFTLKQEIQALPSEIRALEGQVKELTSCINDFNNVKSGIEGLKVDLALLKEKVNLIDRLLSMKEELKKIKDKEKQKQKKAEIQEAVRKFNEKKSRIYRLKNILLGNLRKMDKEEDPEKRQELEDKIKDAKDKLARESEKYEKEEEPPSEPQPAPEEAKEAKPALPTPKIPDVWEFIMKYIRAMFSMAEVNDYLGWINNNFNGTIPEIDSGDGISFEIIYHLNSTVGVGFCYEHFSTSSDGTLVNPWPPYNQLSHAQKLSADGFLGLATFSIPQGAKNLDVRGIFGAGLYRSTYDESENGFTIKGNGTGFGYKIGLGLNYSFTEKFGICGEASYRGIKVDSFTDSAGNTLQYISSYGGGDIKADFSGFGISAGIFFKF